jgi:thiol-disulfide isomerase/thioredoxin
MPDQQTTSPRSAHHSQSAPPARSSRAAQAVLSLAGIALIGVTLLGSAAVATAGGDWNDTGIEWKSYDDGIAAAKETKKPVVLIFYTEWCPHCTSYSALFKNPSVVEKAKNFVMIRVERDAHQELSAQYAPDGQYIPRTFFLSPAAKLLGDIQEQRPSYKYFYDTSSPASLLRSMDAVLAGPKASTPKPE